MMEKIIEMIKNHKIATAIIAMVACAWMVFIVLVCINETYIEFSVAEDSTIEIEYGSDTQMEAITALYKGTIFNQEGTPVEVQIDGQVAYDKVGEYQISCHAERKKTVGDIKVTVKVVDTQAPEISLVSNPEHYTSPVGHYEEEGYTAVDNYDGDITANVVAEEKEGKVYYSVTDSSGNQATAEREIIYKDVIAPIIYLNGRQTMTMYVGGRYAEAGYMAADECDGDITGNVTVEGGVNTQQAGLYNVVYRVSDSSGNTTEVKRTIHVKTPLSGEKVIYLTFDDGPSAYTQRLLDVLDRYNVKATFFVTGAHPNYYHLIGEAHRRGHTIAIHTFSHVYGDIYSSLEGYLADFNRIKDIVVQQTGVEPWLFRFPGGTSNTVSRRYCSGIMSLLAQEMTSRGYIYTDWNVSSGDAGGTTSEQGVINNVINGCASKGTSIVLQHDIKSFSVDAVDDIIEWGLANGYSFKAMDQNAPVVQYNPNN